jgi:hypothetical protein
MNRIGDAMPLEPGGKLRVELIDVDGKWQNIEVRVDGHVLHRFANHQESRAGWKGELPGDEHSRLEVVLRRKYGSIFPRWDVLLNGRALPGSQWDPERQVRNASNFLFALGAWPLFELAEATGGTRTFIITQAALFVGLGALARLRQRGLAIAALVVAVIVLVLRAALVVTASTIPFYWRALSVLFVLWLVRDARAAFDLRPSATRR